MNEPSAISEILGCLLFFVAAGALAAGWGAVSCFIRSGRARLSGYEARVSKSGKVE